MLPLNLFVSYCRSIMPVQLLQRVEGLGWKGLSAHDTANCLLGVKVFRTPMCKAEPFTIPWIPFR